MADGYRGVVGAIPFAFRRSDSWLLRIYVAVSTLAAALVGAMFAIALVVLIANTAAVRGGSLTLSRAFFVVVALFAVAPMLAPTLFVARRHRRGLPVSPHYDALLALAGFLFLLALYAGVVASVPAQFDFDGEVVTRPTPTGLLAPAVALLYAVPPAAAPLIPVGAAALIYVVHRLLRRGQSAPPPPPARE